MASAVFSLYCSPEQLLRYYSGHTQALRVQTEAGVWLQLPLSALRPFVTRAGISGRFTVFFDEHYKLIRVTRTEDGIGCS